MYYLYIDAEFDAVRLNGKFQQAVISIGAVLSDENLEVLDEFYMLVRPDRFKRLSNIVKKITRLTDMDILNARDLREVLIHFKHWLLKYVDELSDIQAYSFGPDDRRTLCTRCEQLHIVQHGVFERMQDLQKLISSSIIYEDKVVSPALSLDDVKYAYGVDGKVNHNALQDAKDLRDIHVAYLSKQIHQEHVKEIVERKARKQEEARIRQQEKLKQAMQERFRDYPHEEINIPLYPEVIEQFQIWTERDHISRIHWKKRILVIDDVTYPYEQLGLKMQLFLTDTPSVCLKMYHDEQCFKKTFPLKYRYATMVETILKRVLA